MKDMIIDKMEEKQMLAAILHYKCGYSQKKIADLMSISQSTMSTWIKIGGLLLENQKLKATVNRLMVQLESKGIPIMLPKPELSKDIIEIVE